MKHIAAYALLVLGGKKNPSAKDVEAVLKAAGATSDSAKVEVLVAALKDKEFHELVGEGLAAMSSMGTAAPAAVATETAPAEEKQEEKKEEEEEEEFDMGGLFD